jgi:hypothetical protein
MKLRLTELRQAAEIILSQLAMEGLDEIELTKDYYWSIPKEQRYDPYAKPSELTLGQLSDDWKEIHRLVTGEQEAAPYHLEWLSSLLRYVSDQT